MDRNYSFFDDVINELDQGLRTIVLKPTHSQRNNPATSIDETDLSDAERTLAGRLMRVNHAGEVAAQGLYNGQALTAKNTEVREQMQHSANEEEDHLAWCQQRLNELRTSRSAIGPFWYAGSYVLGASAGLAGDKWSLGFVAETERQVVKHIDDHLSKLPKIDAKSCAILKQMREDELQHGKAAEDAGASELPKPVKAAMHAVSRVMVFGAYWV